MYNKVSTRLFLSSLNSEMRKKYENLLECNNSSITRRTEAFSPIDKTKNEVSKLYKSIMNSNYDYEAIKYIYELCNIITTDPYFKTVLRPSLFDFTLLENVIENDIDSGTTSTCRKRAFYQKLCSCKKYINEKSYGIILNSLKKYFFVEKVPNTRLYCY